MDGIKYKDVPNDVKLRIRNSLDNIGLVKEVDYSLFRVYSQDGSNTLCLGFKDKERQKIAMSKIDNALLEFASVYIW